MNSGRQLDTLMADPWRLSVHPLLVIAARNISRNRKRTALTLGALIVGISIMMSLRGFINSVLAAQIDAAIYGYTGMIQIHKAGYSKNVLSSPLDQSLQDTKELREKILNVPGVVGITPRLQFTGLYSTAPDSLGNSETSFMGLLGIDPSTEASVAPNLKSWTTDGTFLTEADSREIVINKDLAAIIKSKIDPHLDESMWPVLLSADIDGSLNGEVLKPVGLLANAVPGDKRFALVPIETARKLLRMEGQATSYLVKIKDLQSVNQVAAQLKSELGPDFEVQTWDELLPVLVKMTSDIQRVFYFISIAFYIVIILGIVNAMFMSVLERTREIGTMMSVGVRRNQIIMLFIAEGFFQAVIGALSGILCGYLLVYLMNRIGIPISAPGSTFKIMMRPFLTTDWVLLNGFLTILFTSAISFWPAYRASCLNPVEALQST